MLEGPFPFDVGRWTLVLGSPTRSLPERHQTNKLPPPCCVVNNICPHTAEQCICAPRPPHATMRPAAASCAPRPSGPDSHCFSLAEVYLGQREKAEQPEGRKVNKVARVRLLSPRSL